MKQRIKISICLTLLIMFAVIITAKDTHAVVRLFEDKLILNGYAKQVGFYRTTQTDRDKKYHDTSLDFFKTSAGFEALYKINETEDSSLRFFTGMKWWYEWSMKIDDKLRRNIPRDSRKYYTTPENFDDDVLNEAYIDYIKGPWQIRVGKQVVVWGNLDADRAADVVNAVDFRHSIFGIDKWEEFKRGAWMIRMFYQSELPGNLRFEVILNPGDFKRNLIPFTEGYHYGPDADELLESRDNPGLSYLPDFGWGYAGWLGEKMRKDAPGYSTSNWELGFKISGYTWNWDWSLLYYDHINKDPVAAPDALSDWATQYFAYGAIGDASPFGYPTNSGAEVFKYKRSQIVGGTLERDLLSGGPVFRGGILTFEWFYEIGTPLNKTGGPDPGATVVYVPRQDSQKGYYRRRCKVLSED